MRIHMVSIGSTGDVRPYVLLGSELKRRGHDVTIVAFDRFEDMAGKAGLGFYALPGDVMELMDRIMKPGVNGTRFLDQVEKALGKIAPALLQALLDDFQDADAMICNFFGSMYYSVAEKYGIPVVQTQFFPMDKNDETPISSAPFLKLGKAWNRASYHLGYWLIHLLERRYLTDWRKQNGMTVPPIHGGPDYELLGHTVPVIYAISVQVLPRPNSWGAHIHMSGFWQDETPLSYTPDPKLKAFLNAGEKPVYIGFGSMVSGNMDKTFAIVSKAIKASGLRVVLDKGWSGGVLANLPNVYVLEGFTPHDWLFPQMRAVVHHGGAGTTAAGLRAGKPTLVIPFGGDQPFWASRVRALNCGPRPIRRENLTVRRLTSALLNLVHHSAYYEAAEQLGAALRQEHGLTCAANLVEQELWLWQSDTAHMKHE